MKPGSPVIEYSFDVSNSERRKKHMNHLNVGVAQFQAHWIVVY